MAAVRVPAPPTRLWPQIEEIVPPELPRDVAVARLVALVRSLLIENRQLREMLGATTRSDEPLEAA